MAPVVDGEPGTDIEALADDAYLEGKKKGRLSELPYEDFVPLIAVWYSHQFIEKLEDHARLPGLY